LNWPNLPASEQGRFRSEISSNLRIFEDKGAMRRHI
jgi:hypothetical protein